MCTLKLKFTAEDGNILCHRFHQDGRPYELDNGKPILYRRTGTHPFYKALHPDSRRDWDNAVIEAGWPKGTRG